MLFEDNSQFLEQYFHSILSTYYKYTWKQETYFKL